MKFKNLPSLLRVALPSVLRVDGPNLPSLLRVDRPKTPLKSTLTSEGPLKKSLYQDGAVSSEVEGYDTHALTAGAIGTGKPNGRVLR
jgi:hypothetical protein